MVWEIKNMKVPIRQNECRIAGYAMVIAPLLLLAVVFPPLLLFFPFLFFISLPILFQRAESAVIPAAVLFRRNISPRGPPA